MWRDPGKTLNVVGFVLTSFSTVVVALRLYCRHIRMRAVGAADYIMFIALSCTWASTVVNYFQVVFGREAKLRSINKDSTAPEVQAAIAGTLVTWFIYRPLYILTLSLVKLSILTFYRTLVPPYSVRRSLRVFRYITHALMVFTTLYAISMIAASIFQCAPISAAYSVSASQSQLPEHQNIPRPHCYKPPPLWAFSAVNNFATDIAILLLPIPVILSLQQVPRQKKLTLLGMFSVGTLATAASAVRMWILVLWSKDIKSRKEFGVDLLIWGQIEVNCGIVGASVMFLRPLLRARRDERKSEIQYSHKVLQRVEMNDMTGGNVSVAASGKIIDGRLGIDEEKEHVLAQIL